jgi:hypothetical protein
MPATPLFVGPDTQSTGGNMNSDLMLAIVSDSTIAVHCTSWDASFSTSGGVPCGGVAGGFDGRKIGADPAAAMSWSAWGAGLPSRSAVLRA